MVRSGQIRACRQFKDMINEIRAEYVLKGKRPPSTAKITNAIIKKYKIRKEDLLYDKAIKF